MSLLAKIKQAVSKKKTEHGERSAVSTVLIQHGYTAQPEVERRKQPDNTVLRLYTWYDTPAGDVTLVAGPSIEGEVIQLNPPEVYREAKPVLAPYDAPRRANRRKKPSKPSRRPSRPSTHAFDHHESIPLGNPSIADQTAEVRAIVRPIAQKHGERVSVRKGTGSIRGRVSVQSSPYLTDPRLNREIIKALIAAGYVSAVHGSTLQSQLGLAEEWDHAKVGLLVVKPAQGKAKSNPSAMALNIDLPNYSPSDRDEFLKEPLAWLHDDYKVWILSGIGGVPYVSITPKDSDANFVENIRGDFNTIVNAVEVLYQNKGVPWGPREITQQIMRHPGNRALIAALRTKSNPLRSNPPKGPQKKDLWAFSSYSEMPVGIEGVSPLTKDWPSVSGVILPAGTDTVYWGDIIQSVSPGYTGSDYAVGAAVIRFFLKNLFKITSKEVKVTVHNTWLADIDLNSAYGGKYAGEGKSLDAVQASALRQAFMLDGNKLYAGKNGKWNLDESFRMKSTKGVIWDQGADYAYQGAGGWEMPAKYANYVAALTASAFKANGIPITPEAEQRLKSTPGQKSFKVGLKDWTEKKVSAGKAKGPPGQTAADKFFAEGETPTPATPAQADDVSFVFVPHVGTGDEAVLYLTGPTYDLKDSILKPVGFKWSGKYGKKNLGVPQKVWYYPQPKDYDFWSGFLESFVPQILESGNTFSLDWDPTGPDMIAGYAAGYWVNKLKKHLLTEGVVSEVEPEEDYAEKIMDDLGLGEDAAKAKKELEEEIAAPVKTIELKEPNINKQVEWQDYVKQLASPSDYMQTTAFVEQKKELTPAAYDEFVLDFFKDYPWLAGKGGNGSNYKVPAKYGSTSYYNLPEDIREKWKEKAYTLVTEVSAPGRNTIYVDPQGHNYARYVLFPLDATSAWVPIKESLAQSQVNEFLTKYGVGSNASAGLYAFGKKLYTSGASNSFTPSQIKWIIQAYTLGAFGPAFPDVGEYGQQFPESTVPDGSQMPLKTFAIQAFLDERPFPSHNWSLDMFNLDVKPGTQKGSNPGGEGSLDGGGKFYVKFGDPNHTFGGQRKKLANEVLANQLYRLAGCLAPDARLGIVKDPNFVPGETLEWRIAYCSPWIVNYGKVWAANQFFSKPPIKTYFAQTLPVDLVLTNWDFTGASYDNILQRENPSVMEFLTGEPPAPQRVDDSAFLRVDNGGALLYRAQGVLKDYAKIKKKGYKKELYEWVTSGNKQALYGEQGMFSQTAAGEWFFSESKAAGQQFYMNLVVGCDQRLKVFEELAKDYHGTNLMARCGLEGQSAKYLTLLHNRAKGFTEYVMKKLWKEWGLSAAWVESMKDIVGAEAAEAEAAAAFAAKVVQPPVSAPSGGFPAGLVGELVHLMVTGQVSTPEGELPDGCLIAPVIKVDGKYWFYGTSVSSPVQLFKTIDGFPHRVAQSSANVEATASTLHEKTKDGNLPIYYMLIYAPDGATKPPTSNQPIKSLARVMEALNKFKKNELSANEFIKLSKNKPWTLSPSVTSYDEEKGEAPVVSTSIKAAGALFTDGERVLLARRSTNLGKNSRKFQSTTGGDWALPGGKIDPGETALKAAVRETKEELGSVPKYLDTGVRLSTTTPGESGTVEYTTVVLKVSKGAADTYKPKIKGDYAWETDGWAWVPLSEFDILSDDAGNLKAEWHPKIHAGLGLPIEFAEGAPTSIIALLAQNADEWIAPTPKVPKGTGGLEKGIPFKQNPNGNGHTGWIEDMGQQMLLVDGELAGYVELDEDTDHYVVYTPLDEVITKVDKWYGPEAQNEAAFALMEHAGIDPENFTGMAYNPRRRNPSGYVLSGLRKSPISGSYIEYRPRMPDGSRPRIRVSLESPTVATEQVATELRQYAKGRNLGKYWTSDKEITSGKALSRLGTFTGGKMIWPKWAMPKFAEAASLIYGEKATPKMLFENQLLQIAGLPITEVVPAAEQVIAKVEAEPIPMKLEEVYHQPVGKGVITTKQKKIVAGIKKQLTNLLGTSLSKTSGEGAISAEKAKALKEKLSKIISAKKGGSNINNEAAAKYLRLLVKAKNAGLWKQYLDPGDMVLYRYVGGDLTTHSSSENSQTKEQMKAMKKNGQIGVDALVTGKENPDLGVWAQKWIYAQRVGTFDTSKSYTRYKTKNAYKTVPHKKVVVPEEVPGPDGSLISLNKFAQIQDAVSSSPSDIKHGQTYPVPDWADDVWANVEGFHIDWNGANFPGGPRLESWSSDLNVWAGPTQLRARACNSAGFLLLPGAVPPGWANPNQGEREVIHVYSSSKPFPVQVIKAGDNQLSKTQIKAYQIAHPAYGKNLGSKIGRCLPKAALKNPSYRSAWAEKDPIGGGWAVVVDDKKVKGQISHQTTVTDYIFSTETDTEPTIQEINRMIDAGMSNAEIGSYLFQKDKWEEQEYGRDERSHKGYLLRNPDAKRVAHTIVQQLGGRPTMMIGAKNLAYGYEGKNKSRPFFSMRFPNRARSKPNYIKVILEPTDTYTIKWGRVHKYDLLDKGVLYNIYGDQLIPLFEETTGLYLTF